MVGEKDLCLSQSRSSPSGHSSSTVITFWNDQLPHTLLQPLLYSGPPPSRDGSFGCCGALPYSASFLTACWLLAFTCAAQHPVEANQEEAISLPWASQGICSCLTGFSSVWRSRWLSVDGSQEQQQRSFLEVSPLLESGLIKSSNGSFNSILLGAC